MAKFIPPKEWLLLYDTDQKKFIVKKTETVITDNMWRYVRGLHTPLTIMGQYETAEEARAAIAGLTPLFGFAKKMAA